MRRSLIIALVVVACSAAGAALGAVAGAASSTRAQPLARGIVCPLGGGVTTPCCGPPIATTQITGAPSAPAVRSVCCPGATTPCCPPNAMCVTPAATITASPEPSMSGAPVTISGTITGAGGAAVELWEELPGQTAFSSVASTTAGAGGEYSFTRPAGAVTSNRGWYVTSGSLRSAAVRHEVEAKLTMSVSLRRPAIGRAVTVTGAVGPSHAGERVLLEQYIGRSWTVFARARLTHASRFRVRHRFRRTGTVGLQALLPADQLNVQSRSAMITLTVRRDA